MVRDKGMFSLSVEVFRFKRHETHSTGLLSMNCVRGVESAWSCVTLSIVWEERIGLRRKLNQRRSLSLSGHEPQLTRWNAVVMLPSVSWQYCSIT